MPPDEVRRPNRAHGAIDRLPTEVQCQVKDWYLAHIPYDEMVEKLNELLGELGLRETVSRGQLWRWCARQRRDLERIERANEKAEILVKHLVGDSGDVGEAAEGLCKAVLLEALADAEPMKAQEVQDVAAIAHSLGRLASSKVAREKWEQEKRKKIEEAVEVIKRGIQEELKEHPELIRNLLAVTDAAKEKMLERP